MLVEFFGRETLEHGKHTGGVAKKRGVAEAAGLLAP